MFKSLKKLAVTARQYTFGAAAMLAALATVACVVVVLILGNIAKWSFEELNDFLEDLPDTLSNAWDHSFNAD